MTSKIALVTGANSGAGFGICQRLLERYRFGVEYRVILGCRNQKRAEEARDKLLKQFPRAKVEILLVDTSSASSVFKAAAEFKQRFDRLDCLYCNAGIMPTERFDLKAGLQQLFTTPKDFFRRPACVVQPVGAKSKDGLGLVFSTNVFGHYLLIREIESQLNAAADPRIIWTGSTTADRSAFSLEDYQCLEGHYPYDSSKFLMDILSVSLNQKYAETNIRSYVTHPGVIYSGYVTEFPLWFQYLVIIPLFYLARLFFITSLVINGYNAAAAHTFLTNTTRQNIDTFTKYHSECLPWGASFVTPHKIDNYDPKEGEQLIKVLDELADSLEHLRS
ncbi:3-keto-steroid reductase [Basidiobolus meristosporus CBS 931.73]|uniref:3-keto-steroid reductase n=1 Tax=Basidiobolus meristosporus CBS 931.73 TaxID=1314790 RepID=A0A1Y1YAP9_9FUNG|nr:3-keto-steroid reductase [Basidiobolus meristosporus CBS 931.73]|eukprot:ORX95111.1 3-keto-steroid reductase [Basidiobolus meristosporus CBS 931.73]